MTRMLLALSLLLTMSNVFAEDVICTISASTEEVGSVAFSVAPNTKEMFVDSDSYRFYLSNKGHSKFELEIFDAYAPSRSYATGYLRTADDELSWAFWSRDILLETTCRLQ